MRTALSFLTSLLFLSPAYAQAPLLVNVQHQHSTSPIQSVDFEVRLAGGDLADTIGREDVQVEENGQRISGELTTAVAGDGIAYVIVLDTSGSMVRLLPEVGPALAGLLSDLRPSDRVALVTFNDDVEVVQALTADHAAVRTALGAIRNGGVTTELFYALTEAAKLLEGPGVPARRVLVVVSDGKDEGTAYTLDDAIAAASSASANIAALGVGGSDPRHLKTLQRMAAMTGGIYSQVDPGQTWSDKTALISKYVRARYRFRWQSTVTADGAPHPAKLQVSLGAVTLSHPLTVKLAATPVAPRPRWIPWTGAAAGAVVVLLGAVFFVSRARKRSRAALAEVERRLDDERRAKDELQAELEGDISSLRGKLATIEEKIPEPAPVGITAKRKTMYSSGAAGTPATYGSARLHVLDGPLQGARLSLLSITSMGRDDDNNVVLHDDRVSLHHARIVRDRDTWWLEDLGSTNGTFVDEARVTARHRLGDGHMIRVGSVSMRFVGEQ